MMEEQTIQYRLGQIEHSLEELKELIISVKLNEKDIHSLEERVEKAEGKISEHERSINELRLGPTIAKADKWQKIADYVFKIALTSIVAWTCSRIGIKL